MIQKEIMDHVLEKHSTADVSDNYGDPDHQMKSEDSSEASDLETENVRRRMVSKLRFVPEQSVEKLRKFCFKILFILVLKVDMNFLLS